MAETFEPRDFVHECRNLHMRHGKFCWSIVFPAKRAAKQACWALTHASSVVGLEVGIDDIIWALRLNGIIVTADK